MGSQIMCYCGLVLCKSEKLLYTCINLAIGMGVGYMLDNTLFSTLLSAV